MIIMFHRIANKPTCCPIERFTRQVKLAKKLDATLTFDDGLREHYKIAYPILKKHGIKGYFFVITNCQNEMAQAHKIWLLLSQAQALIKRFNIDDEKYLSAEWYTYDPPSIANLKFYLDTHPEDLNSVFHECYDEQAEIKKMYMNWDELKQMHDEGMVIGNHTHTHQMLPKLSAEEQEKEIQVSTEILSKKIARPYAFAYPFGMYSPSTIALLKKYKYYWAVTVEPEDPLLLRRIDTNEFY
jgi:peptidoglycan/xylan/chitin deacetylase (PgdA/CDA1 family)